MDCPYCLCKNFQYVPYLVYFVKFEFLFQCAIIILVILLILYLSGCKSCGCRTRQRRSENGPGNVDKERSVAIAFDCRIIFIIFGEKYFFISSWIYIKYYFHLVWHEPKLMKIILEFQSVILQFVIFSIIYSCKWNEAIIFLSIV